jgi:hypothetical protein
MKRTIPDVHGLLVPPQLMRYLLILLAHPEVRHKFVLAKTVAKGRYYTLHFQASPPRYLSDEETYKRYPLLQRILPRGLTIVFVAHQTDLCYCNVVFPTPKFFGDNDVDDDVKVISNTDLQQYASSDQRYIVTEKVNGEMFTFSVIAKDKEEDEGFNKPWLIMMGSKNNKFLFRVYPGFVEDCIDEGIQRKFQSENRLDEYNHHNLNNSEWVYSNLWVEMCIVFAAKLDELPTNRLEMLFTWLCDEELTLCGELESYLHPHLISFPENHQRMVFFAITGHTSTYEILVPNALQNVKLLQTLEEEFSLDVVAHSETNDSLFTIKNAIRYRTECEGVVVLVVKRGKLVDRVKLKTIWYVVHRGFREKLRKIIFRKQPNKHHDDITASYVENILRNTLKGKLAIFSLDMTWKDAYIYDDYIKSVSRYVEDCSRTSMKSLKKLFMYDYPKFMKMGKEYSTSQ